eukprot:TRINITY_DN1527_c0_g1_i1.p1 TRINITY_DN1527_c0_g1~~TRINITY_DN1527_c0_g1_i1.p1  ORF type:complete len:373 (-),score=74.92 TRINITY_DN1527_c0_g1_i1:286-1404(-)
MNPMRVIILTLMLLAIVAQAGECPTSRDDIKNVNGDFFFNKCFMEVPQGFGTSLANLVMFNFNPVTSCNIIMAIVLFLPILFFSIDSNPNPTSDPKTIQRFKHVQLHTLNFLHRINFSYATNCFFYTIFRQRRPCFKLCDGKYMGSIYGMPSGDAMHGGIIGGYLWDRAPINKWAARTLAIALMILACAERVLLGFHSIGQVTTGCVIGFVLHYYSTRMPQYMLFIDTAITLVGGIIGTALDSNLDDYHAFDSNNIRQWFSQSVAFAVFDAVLVARYYYINYQDQNDRMKAVSKPLYEQTTPMANVPPEIRIMNPTTNSNETLEQGLITEKPNSSMGELFHVSDMPFTWLIFAFVLIENLFAYLVEWYAWKV